MYIRYTTSRGQVGLRPHCPGYRSVMPWLTNGVRHLYGLALPTSSALTQARQRLGSKPLELLFDLRRGPLAGEGTAGAFAFGLRLVA